MRRWPALLLLVAWTAAFAERADRQKPIHVESDRMNADDIKQVAVFQGRVVVTQGTFMLCADQVTIREDKAGNQSGTAVGNPATFREKRDNSDDWIEGEAQRIDYDNSSETVELFNRAKVNRDRDEVRGNYISYDARTEFIKVQNDKQQADGAPVKEQRVTAVFNPKAKAGDGTAPGAAPRPAAPPLRTDTTLSPPGSARPAAPGPARCR